MAHFKNVYLATNMKGQEYIIRESLKPVDQDKEERFYIVHGAVPRSGLMTLDQAFKEIMSYMKFDEA